MLSSIAEPTRHDVVVDSADSLAALSALGLLELELTDVRTYELPKAGAIVVCGCGGSSSCGCGGCTTRP
jgi:hypothetical protein